MKKFLNFLAATLFIVACSAAFAGKGNADKPVGNMGNPGVAPPQSMPYGKSYSEWSMAWWVYAITTPLDVLPFGYGTDASYGQSGPVFFLGGTFTGANLDREITIPPGKALFFPVMDVECSTIEPYNPDDPQNDFHGDNEAELRACAAGWVDRAIAGEFGPIFCKVDGVELKNLVQYRVQTPLMYFVLPEMAGDNNIFFMPIPAGQEVRSVGDGLYIMLNPLAKGTHTVEFQNIHYTIHVVGGK